MEKHYSLGIYDYNRNKICELYDSEVELVGQAYDIVVTEEMNGYHTLEFSIPYMVEGTKLVGSDIASLYGTAIYGINKFGSSGSSEKMFRNYRWDYLKSDYLIRYAEDNKTIWYVATKPVKKKSKEIVGTVTCNGFESLLKTRNIYMEFDDTNGIGNMKYLMDQILMGTMWTYDDVHSDTLCESDGTTVKVRSLTSGSKQGALGNISTVCNLFKARPIFDTENQKIIIKAMNNREQVLEGEVGRNLNALTVKRDSSNVCTRVYIEGEYGDHGYVGIDDVKVDANGDPDDSGTAWGLPFMMNFDYYRDIGVFKQTHETALATYLTDIRQVKADIREAGQRVIETEDMLNTMVGQCKFVLYYAENLTEPQYTYGSVTAEQAVLNVGDEVLILKNDHTHEYQEWENDPSTQLAGAYGVAKFITKSAGKIGAAEVQIESKQKTIETIDKKIGNLAEGDPKIPEYEQEKQDLLDQITIIYTGTASTEGLYKMMEDVMKPNGLLYVYDTYSKYVEELNEDQDEIEATFISAMGYMLRDGYWSNQNYITGQEVFLYMDSKDMVKEMAYPAAEYSFDYVRIAEDFDIPMEDIAINAIFKIYDKELQVEENMFVKKISYGVDDKTKGNIEVSNQDITLTGTDLGSLLSRMSQLADLIEQKNALYERAKAISESGSIYADRLNGQIDVTKTQILSSVSNWRTDDNGNIMFETTDGSGAMMLSGAGFMLASTKDDQGNWNWRMLGDSRGLTADEIVSGFISADRIEAGSIQASHLSSNIGESLNLESNQSLNVIIDNAISAAQLELTDEQFRVMFRDNEQENVNNAIAAAAGGVQANLDDYAASVSVYMRYDNEGVLTLGKNDEAFTTEITNRKLAFKDGDTEVAYISNQNMYITNANVTETLSIGKDNGFGFFDWTVTSTGLGLKWRDTEFGNIHLTTVMVSEKTGDTNQQFAVTVTLDDSTITGTYGDMTFTAGVSTVNMKHGDIVEAKRLPVGIGYTVTEASVTNFHVASSSGTTGEVSTIRADVVFVNARNTGNVDLAVVTVSSDQADESQEFVFTVSLNDSNVQGEHGDMTFTNGVATVTLRGGQHAVATNLPVTVMYTITQTPVFGFTTTYTGDSGLISVLTSNPTFINTRV